MKTQMVFKLPENLGGEIDEVDRLLATGNTDLILDFAGCAFIAVEALEWLEELLLRATALASGVNFINVRPDIYKVFKVARINPLLKACKGQAVSGPVC